MDCEISHEGRRVTDVRFGPGVGLLVVDVQNDFADPKGSLFVTGGPEVVGAVNRLVAEAETVGSPVVYTQDWHPPDTPHFAKDGGVWPVHCVAGTWGAQFHPALVVDGQSVRKGTNGEDGYSGFTMRDARSGEQVPTLLAPLLQSAGVTDVVVTGLATDYCVKATALDALRLGFATTVLTDGIAAVNLRDGDGEAALDELRNAGADVRSSRGA
jgi:nicotinamidase/pyrazinamidase